MIVCDSLYSLICKIFKKLIYHTEMREYKIKILHQFFIEFILKAKIVYDFDVIV